MATRKFEGTQRSDEVSTRRFRQDLRSIPEKIGDWWQEPDGQSNTFIILFVVSLLLVWVPLAGETLLILFFVFSKILLGYKKKKWAFPLRVPIIAKLLDDSTNKLGEGLIFLGNEVKSRMPAYTSDNDARTHALLFGTTGSGKTELLLAFVVNSLIYDGGASYTDGKGDVKLWLKFLIMCRMLGREDDLLLISFITSGHEFYDRQESKISNTMNMYAMGSSGMCTEASISLMDGGKGGDDMWKGRAIAFLGALIKPLVFLRDKGELLLSADMIREYFDLPILERFVWDEEDTWKDGLKRESGYFKKAYGKVWDRVIRPLQAFMVTIPGYDKARLGQQEQKTLEQHGYITMQLARLFGDLADNYGHIMQTPLGEVEMYDVVINDRVLVTLLPALERSPESLGMLGKIIVGGIKQMAAGCLGNKVEGLRREIVDARPTTSPVPFPTIFDEYGYYAVLGFSSMPAQARSLGFSVIFAAQDFASLKKSSPEEADQTWENTNLRGIGRITSGSAAETYKRMSELGGTAKVARITGYERVIGMFRTRMRASEQVSIESEERVNADDLHSQADGEFHLFMGMKENEASEGRVRVVRINGFYTDIGLPKGSNDKREQKPISWLSINHFARIPPPTVIMDPRSDPGLYGPKGAIEAIRAGVLPASVESNASRAPTLTAMKMLGQKNVDLAKDQQFSALDLGFVYMTFSVFRQDKQNAEIQGYLASSERSSSRVASTVVETPMADAGTGSGASEGPMLLPPTALFAPVLVSPDPVAPAPPTALSLQMVRTTPIVKSSSPVAELTEQDKETLAKISLFAGGAVSIPVNNLTEADLLNLASDLLAAGDSVFGVDTSVKEALSESEVTGLLQVNLPGLGGEELVDAVLAVESHVEVKSPQETASARAQGRDFVNKMALGTTYLEVPIPKEHYGMSSFLEAVEALNSVVLGRDE